MILTYILFALGFIFLIKGADWLVEGSSEVAKRFHISDLVIGLTIVAFGTSMPELIVNVFASMQGSADVAFGNIIGSNIGNVLLILGIAALIYPLTVNRGTTWKEIPLSLLAAIVLGFMVNDGFLEKKSFSGLGLIDGVILLAFFAIFLYYTIGISKSEKSQKIKIKKHSILIDIAMIVGGFTGLIIGGKWIVDGAIVIARNVGISEALIGLTIVAVGTSLPELATSAMAAYRKKADIAIGNVVGSNIFNIFFILGTSALIRPLEFSPTLNTDIFILIGTSLLLFLFMFIGKRHQLERWQGVLFILLYMSYTGFLIYRG